MHYYKYLLSEIELSSLRVSIHFRMYLTTHVTSADFRQGYSMTGTLERGNKKKGSLHLTHFAMLKRKDYLKDDNNNK